MIYKKAVYDRTNYRQGDAKTHCCRAKIQIYHVNSPKIKKYRTGPNTAIHQLNAMDHE
jgi:hypothetical protein